MGQVRLAGQVGQVKTSVMRGSYLRTAVRSAPALVLVLVITVVGAAGAGKNTHTPVTVTIADMQNGYPLRVGSDMHGAYVEIDRKITSAIERYATGTDWMLTTYSGTRLIPSNRTVFFDLREPFLPPSSGIPAPFSTAYTQAHLIAQCRLAADPRDRDLFALQSGESADCPGAFRFQAPTGAWYRFAFSPQNFPVDPLRVTCQSTDASGCKVWTVTPSATRVTGSDPNPKNLNRLLEIEDATQNYLADLSRSP
jgi:hypothetical protein